jgi:hypothetical protein
VHCFGVEEVSKSQAWIWLEAREGAGPHALWTIEQLALAAYDFGALAAQWQSKLPDVGQYPWLAQRWLRGWVALVRIFAVDHFLEHDGCGNGSAVEQFLNGSTRRRIAELISDADDLLAGFDSQPVTLAHHDPQRGNLFAAAPNESPARTVAIDWGFFGLAPVGSDLGLHIGQNIMSWGIDQRRAAEHYRASTAAYISGLQDYGWSGDVDSVRFARATAAALNAGAWLAMEVSWLCPDMAERFGSDDAAWPTRVAAKQGISATTVVERWASGFNYVLDLANEAHQLLPHVHVELCACPDGLLNRDRFAGRRVGRSSAAATPPPGTSPAGSWATAETQPRGARRPPSNDPLEMTTAPGGATDQDV